MKLILDETPPSVNHYKGIRIMKTKTGKMFPLYYLTAKAKAFKEKCRNKYNGPIFKGRLAVHVYLFFKGNRNHDVDNYTKTIFDALNGIAWEDDKQIYDMVVHKEIGFDYPETIIEIVEYDNQK